jgi:hypothetical protein
MGPNRTTERSRGQQGTRLGDELGSETATWSNNFDKRMFSAVTNTIPIRFTGLGRAHRVVSARIRSATWLVTGIALRAFAGRRHAADASSASRARMRHCGSAA